MQKRAAHQADLIGVAMPVQVEPVRNARHPQAMLVGGDGAVLDEMLHLQRSRVIGKSAQDLVHPRFLRRGKLANHRQHSFPIHCAFIIPQCTERGNGMGKFLQNSILTQHHSSVCLLSISFKVCPSFVFHVCGPLTL